MKKIYAFITARSSSTRLSQKCFLDFNGINTLEHIILRCKYGNLFPIICTTTNKKDNKIEKIAKDLKIPYFRGPEKNKILRWFLCAKKFNIKIFHTVDADDPFFDWTAINKSMQQLDLKKIDIMFPSKVSWNGGASEGYSISFKCLEKIFKFNPSLKKESKELEFIEPYVRNKKFKFKTFKGMSYEIKSARLTLDYNEDYIFLKKISKHNGSFNDRKNINFFLKKNSNLLKINLHKNFDWKKKQNKIISEVKL
jgi:spore coat polysaccharide biosynthesis protein SpsF|tara:strand:- start:1278 stop:2036 length:759 start_codon:yes stop_codon:yes gene_type:complete